MKEKERRKTAKKVISRISCVKYNVDLDGECLHAARILKVPFIN